ncbi:MAG: HDOD domain-containing protein [Sandaracinaceae bacterium]|nr:HDOD domain-containing protein [Sandaracinaceae bacterium]
MSELAATLPPIASSPERLEPRALAVLGARGAVEAIAKSGRTALVMLDRRTRIGEIWLDRGRILCSEDVPAAAAALAELFAWPRPEVTIIPGARRGGPCAAIPAAVLLSRAQEIGDERLTQLSSLADPTELHEPTEGALPRDGDLHEAAVLRALATQASPFAIIPVGHPSAEIAAAIVRLVRRRAIVRVAPPSEASTPSERPTAPGVTRPADGGLSRLFRWVTSSLSDSSTPVASATPPPESATRTTRPSCRVPGWRPSEAGDARRGHDAETESASWAVLPWDRDRGAIGTDVEAIATRLADALPLERRDAEPFTAALLSRLEEAVMRGLEDVPAMPTLALELRDAIAKETTAREVAEMIDGHEAIARAVLRAGSAAAFGRPPVSLEQAIVRVGLGKVYRLATAPVVGSRVFEARALGARAARARMACQLAGELTSELVAGPLREEAFLAGLLHGLGRLYLGSLADRVPGRPQLSRLEALAMTYQCSIGVLLAARWGLGHEVRLAVATHADAPATLTEPRELPSALRVAQIVACGMTEDPPSPDWRIARALSVREDVPSTPGPILDRARALLTELR